MLNRFHFRAIPFVATVLLVALGVSLGHIFKCEAGDIDISFEGVEGTASARAHHLQVREELPVRALALSKSDPAIPTHFVEASPGQRTIDS